MLSERANPTHADLLSGARVSPLRSQPLNSSTLIGVIFMIRFTPLPSEKILV